MLLRSPAALLCDMDGTLVDTERQWLEVIAGLLPPGADTAPFTGLALDDAARLLAEHGVPGTREELIGRLDVLFLEQVASGVTVQPGAVELLEAARAAGIPTALVTASERHLTDLVLETLGAWRFDVTVAGLEGGRTKPHPDPYLKAAAELGVPAEECVAVEDTPTGVAAARAAGCRVLAVPTSAGIPEDERTAFVESLVGVAFAA